MPRAGLIRHRGTDLDVRLRSPIGFNSPTDASIHILWRIWVEMAGRSTDFREAVRWNFAESLRTVEVRTILSQMDHSPSLGD